MPDTKITALAAITTVAPAADLFPIVDVSDNSMAASGTTKNITVNQLLGAGGTATLASATITGDLTVRTDKLAVRSTGVGIGTTTPNASYILDLTTAYDARARQWVADSSFIGSGNLANGFTIRTLSGTTDGIRFLNYAQSTEFMRIDSTGLGVGGSPIGKFSVIDSTLTGTGQLREQVIRAAADNTNNSLNSLVGFTFSIGSTAYTAGSLVRTAGVYGINLDNSAFGRVVGLSFYTCNQDAAATEKMRIDNSGNVGIGVTPTYKLDTQVAGGADRSIIRGAVTGISGGFQVKWNNATSKIHAIIENIPTSSAGLPSGTLWSDSGTIKIA